MVTSITSGLASALKQIKGYSMADANKDIKAAKDLDFAGAQCVVGKSGSHGGVNGSTDKFVNMFDVNGELAKFLQGAPKVSDALSFIPASIFRPQRFFFLPMMAMNFGAGSPQTLRAIDDQVRYFSLLTGLGTNIDAMKSLKDAEASKILETLLTPPEKNDKTESYLSSWRLAVAGLTYDKKEKLYEVEKLVAEVEKAKFDDKGNLMDKGLAAKVAQIRYSINHDAALMVSIVHLLAVKRMAKCTDGKQELDDKAKEYLATARTWANIARLAKDPEGSAKFVSDLSKFQESNSKLIATEGDVKNDKVTRTKGWMALANALVQGEYTDSGKTFIDTTHTKLYPPLAGFMPSRMMCKNENATVFFSRAENAIVALWHSARIGAMGCFGTLTGGGGGGYQPPDPVKCDEGYRKIRNKCYKITCGAGSVPYKKCKKVETSGGGGFGTQEND